MRQPKYVGYECENQYFSNHNLVEPKSIAYPRLRTNTVGKLHIRVDATCVT